MELLTRYKNVLLLIAAVVLLFIAYTVLFKGDTSDEILNTGVPQGPAEIVERELLGLLIELKEVELDNTIFSDPAFRSLEDFSQELVPLPVGRINPFAPFGVGNFPASRRE